MTLNYYFLDFKPKIVTGTRYSCKNDTKDRGVITKTAYTTYNVLILNLKKLIKQFKIKKDILRHFCVIKGVEIKVSF